MPAPTKQAVGEYVRQAYKTYGTYVIEDRAVADFRDGLKPVQRRIIWAMHKLHMKPAQGFKKCGKVVGAALGDYHPHGDASLYDTLVKMVWGRYPILEGQGNFGTLTDPAAAYRYTEARLAEAAEALLESTDVAPMVENYDGSTEEPLFLPTRLPLFLLNGSEGIAVGLSACTPPHNIAEVEKALLYVLKTKKPTVEGVLAHILGPDYNSGILVSSEEDVHAVYAAGEGTLQFRCNYKFATKGDHRQLIITSYAPRFGPATFMQKCGKLAEANVIEYVTDESSEQNGTRLIVGFLDGYSLQSKVLPLLHTNITYNFHAMERSVNGTGAQLRHFNILDYIVEWIEYRRDYETKILKLEEDRLHKQLSKESARAIAIENIDAILRVLKNKNIDTANLAFELKTALYGSGAGSVTMEQAEYILDTDLRALARANLGDQKQKIKATKLKIKEVKLLLARIDKVLEEKFTELDRYLGKGISLDRGTALRVTEPKIDVTDESSHFVGATTGGKVFRFGDLPMRKANWNWDALIETGRFYAMVESSGVVRQIPTAKYPDGDTECRGVVGVIPSKKSVIVGINKDGLGAAVENPQRLNEYRLLKHKEPLTAAVGMSPGDTLLVWNKDAVQTYEFGDLKVTRRGTMGWRLLSRRHHGIRLAVVPEGGCILNNSGEEIAVSEFLDEWSPQAKFYFVGKENFVIFKDRARALCGPVEISGSLHKREIAKIFPL
jgi:DNA gyrase/topoisomerase IV subunit A